MTMNSVEQAEKAVDMFHRYVSHLPIICFFEILGFCNLSTIKTTRYDCN